MSLYLIDTFTVIYQCLYIKPKPVPEVGRVCQATCCQKPVPENLSVISFTVVPAPFSCQLLTSGIAWMAAKRYASADGSSGLFR